MRTGGITTFCSRGCIDVAEGMAERGVGFVVRRPADGDTLEDFLEEVGAAMVVGDENPMREPERWRSALAKKLRIPFLTVDADVVVPSAVFGKAMSCCITSGRICMGSCRSFLCRFGRLK